MPGRNGPPTVESPLAPNRYKSAATSVPAVRSRAGMHDDSRGLVHHGDVRVFVKERQRNIFCCDAGQRRRGNFHRDLLAGFHVMRRLFRNAAHQHAPFVNERLHVSAAHVRELRGEKTIQALAGLSLQRP